MKNHNSLDIHGAASNITKSIYYNGNFTTVNPQKWNVVIYSLNESDILTDLKNNVFYMFVHNML